MIFAEPDVLSLTTVLASVVSGFEVVTAIEGEIEVEVSPCICSTV